MKTAMQELIEYLDDTISVSIKQKFLEKEKEQIIEAVGFGLGNKKETELGESYYNQTFNQNK